MKKNSFEFLNSTELTDASSFSNLQFQKFSNEISDLKAEKLELLNIISKNEKFMQKAQKIINSKNILDNKNCEENLKENILNLQGRLYEANKNIQELVLKKNDENTKNKELNEKILNLNHENTLIKKENEALRENLDKAISKIRKLKKQQENSNMDSQNEKKLNEILIYNEELYKNYEIILEENSQLKNKIMMIDQEKLCLLDEINDRKKSVHLLKKTENKIENIENNLLKIEENSIILPELEKKLTEFKQKNSDNLKIILYYSQYLKNQFIINETRNLSFIINDNKKTKNFDNFPIKTKNKKINEILENLNITNLMKKYFEINIMKLIEFFMTKFIFFEEKMKICEDKFKNFSNNIRKFKSINKFKKKKKYSNSFDKENISETANIDEYEVNDNKLTKVLNLFIGKLEEYDGYFNSLFTQFSSLLLNFYESKNLNEDISRKIQQISEDNANVVKKIDNLDNYVKKELISLKKEIIFRNRNNKTIGMPKIF